MPSLCPCPGLPTRRPTMRTPTGAVCPTAPSPGGTRTAAWSPTSPTGTLGCSVRLVSEQESITTTRILRTPCSFYIWENSPLRSTVAASCGSTFTGQESCLDWMGLKRQKPRIQQQTLIPSSPRVPTTISSITSTVSLDLQFPAFSPATETCVVSPYMKRSPFCSSTVVLYILLSHYLMSLPFSSILSITGSPGINKPQTTTCQSGDEQCSH